MATQVRFCGRCGAQVAPGAPFCGRCGAPQLAAAVAAPQPGWAAVAGPPAAPPAAFGYQLAQPGAFPAAGRVKVPQFMVIGGLVLILAIAIVAVSAFAVSRAFGTHSTCTANCSPKFVTPLSEPTTYVSSAFKFEVDYNSAWKVQTENADGVSLSTHIGRLDVVGSKAVPSLGQLIDSTVSALPSSKWQGVTKVSDLKGAHIGDQDGVGAIYAANLVGSSATAIKVRFAVIAATRNGVSVLMFAVDPADTKGYPNGIPEGQEFDYLCQEFRWG
ncbi:MAG: zinc ribbon domain-containing protein [Candidatus Dormibacteraeota bacterium]|nr:zinc ribbon domain-containing protein [Candidatus Dormibacteraeota bacterium]